MSSFSWSSWLVPPVLVPLLLICATVAYGIYRALALGAGAAP